MMKKIFAVLLASLMVFSLVGCGDNAQVNVSENTPDSNPDSSVNDQDNTSSEEIEEQVDNEEEMLDTVEENSLVPFVGEWVGKNGNDPDDEMSEDLASYYSITVHPDGKVEVDIDGVVLDTIGAVEDGTLTFTEPTLDISTTATLEDGVLHVENLLDLGINIDMEIKK